MDKWQECDCGFADPKGGYESCPECGATFREESAAEAESRFYSQDFYEEARAGSKPWPGDSDNDR